MADHNKKEGLENQLNIELNEQVAEGTYANLAIISHGQSEFVFDFVRIMPGLQKHKVQSRIVMTPDHAKRLMRALQDNISKFENQFGEIKEPERGGNTIPFPMMPPTEA